MPPDKGNAGGDAPGKKPAKAKSEDSPHTDRRKSLVKGGKHTKDAVETPSQKTLNDPEYRSNLRKQKFKHKWPSVTKVKIHTVPWHPPGPPERPPRVEIEYPPLTRRKWIPKYKRRHKHRPKRLRFTPDQVFPMPATSNLNKVWHKFSTVDRNKMMIRGTKACNSMKYLDDMRGVQTGCIAMVCRALLEEKSPAELVHTDVDDVIDAGDEFYTQCRLAMKCYKGKHALQLNQLLPSFFFRDTKYSVKTFETDRGVLAKHPENNINAPDLQELMDKRQGTNYMSILTVGKDKHFLIWGHPPEQGGHIRTVCYIFDPTMRDELGAGNKCVGAGAFLRFPGVNSFVDDFLQYHGNIDPNKKDALLPEITLTDVEIVQKEPVNRVPRYEIDLKGAKPHCPSEFHALHMNVLIDEKKYKHKHPMASLSAISVATSKSRDRKRIKQFYDKKPVTDPNPPPVPPVPPDRPPAMPSVETAVLALKGTENFFLYTPEPESHLYGRDDLMPPKTEEQVLHSPVDIMDKNFVSQFQQVDAARWILRGTRHCASKRYYTFKIWTAISCCVAALGMLKRLRARGWNEDIIDETLDVGWNLLRESLMERRGPIRRLVLGELKETFFIRDKEYRHKERGIAVWGRLWSRDPKVFDLCRGLDSFFQEADSGILQIPGEFETAIWFEGGKYYLYHPWPADNYGNRVGLQDGGRACLLYFTKIGHLCEHFLKIVNDLKKKPFSISDVRVYELPERPEPINNLKPVAPGRWVVRGHFHEENEKFPESHRGKQATPTAVTAIAMAHVLDPSTWTPDDIDEVLVRGDILYENTMENLEKLGINFENPSPNEEGEAGGEEEEPGPSGTLAAADVLPRFRVTDYDCIETEILDSEYSGKLLSTEPGVMSLKDSLRQLFRDNRAGVLTARGCSVAVWEHDDHFYYFDPRGCDENGYPSDDARAGSALIRLRNNVDELADVIMGNLTPGVDDSFNLSPVDVSASKLNPETGAPETKLENKQFQWLNKRATCILMGPRGENSALGKANERVARQEDLAGRVLGLPAAAAFCAAADAVFPPGMHQDHMFNFLETGAEYYLNHVKKTGRKEITVNDLQEKFEMGLNTFTLELGESTRLPLRLPDKPTGEGGGDEEEEKELGEGEEPEGEPPMKEMKDLLSKLWYDTTKPTQVYLLLGDYHQLGLWMVPGGKVVVFDPAPTLEQGLLTPQRIAKGDELRLQRIKDEMSTEAGQEEEEEAGAEGEEKPVEPEPEFVPPESCPVLIVASNPGELIDRLVMKGGLTPPQAQAPYWLYPVSVINEFTSAVKDKKGGGGGAAGDEGGDEAPEAEEESATEPLDDQYIGTYMTRRTRTIASVRGQCAQGENFFVETPNRDNQDAANAIMGIVVENIEHCNNWKPSLIDAILKYGDRLYTFSLPNASKPPKLKAEEVAKEFHVTNFSVNLDVESETVAGDIRAGDTGPVLNIRRGIKRFFESGNKYGVFCAKEYSVAIWKLDENAYCYWDPHFIGPTGQTSPAGAAGLIIFSGIDEMAETIRKNIENLQLPGTNKFTIASVNVTWEYQKQASEPPPPAKVKDEGYEFKVLTAFMEIAKGRTILRGSKPQALGKFMHDSVIQSAATAVVAASMTRLRKPSLWTYKIVDDIIELGNHLFTASTQAVGYEFRPGEDILLPLQVLTRYVLGSNYIRYDLVTTHTGRLEQKDPKHMTLRAALDNFFEDNTVGIIWCTPYATAIWKTPESPRYYMCEPHACGPTGLRIDAVDDGSPCVMTFTSPKAMANTYLQNTPASERHHQRFELYRMNICVTPLHEFMQEPPLLTAPPGSNIVPATTKVDAFGRKRRGDETSRRHPPGDTTCMDAYRATEQRDQAEKGVYKGRRNPAGWLVLGDGTQFMSANHSISCKRFPYASRGYQALSCSVMAVAMSRVEEVCTWCVSTLDQILESGEQLYQDSYLHYRPENTKLLSIGQILRKFYTPGNCVCRVLVFEARQKGNVDADLQDKLAEFFREERQGVFVAGDEGFAVALFKGPRGYYMFDPADRDRYGRAVAPPCLGKARACLSMYPNVSSLAAKLGANIPPVLQTSNNDADVRFEAPAEFQIYGMAVTGLRRLNQFEK